MAAAAAVPDGVSSCGSTNMRRADHLPQLPIPLPCMGEPTAASRVSPGSSPARSEASYSPHARRPPLTAELMGRRHLTLTLSFSFSELGSREIQRERGMSTRSVHQPMSKIRHQAPPRIAVPDLQPRIAPASTMVALFSSQMERLSSAVTFRAPAAAGPRATAA